MRTIRTKRAQSADAKVERLKAATERARSRQADSGDGEIDIAHAPLSWWRARWADKAIRRTFIENFIYVRDAFDENRLVLLKFNDLQADLHENVTGRDVILKFRRGGVSRYWLASYLADAVVTSGCAVRFVPHDPDTEEEFRADIKMMFEHLPAHLQPATKYYSKPEIVIHDEIKGTVDSRITTATVQPGHEGKGRGQTIKRLLLTEPPHWRGDQKKAATSLIEAAAGGQVAVESTPFGIEWLYSIYQDGKTGVGGWTSHFYYWWWMRHYRIAGAAFKELRSKWVLLLPGQKSSDIWKILPAGATGAQRAFARQRFDAAKITPAERRVALKVLAHLKQKRYVKSRAKWFSSDVAAYIAWRRAKIEELPGGENQFLVEYPENDRDCFEQTGRPVISSQYLKVTCEPAEPIEGHEYVIATDASLGLESGDPAAMAVIDVESGRLAHIETLKRPPDMLAYRMAELSDLYNGALMAPERNNMGIAVIQKLVDLGYEERIYKHLDTRLKRAIEDGRLTIDEAQQQAQLGFPTTAESKPLAGMMLEEAVRREWLGISSQEFCDEARTVVWFDNGSFGAMSGYHDDQFIAVMIAWYVRQMMQGQFTGFVGIMPEVGFAR